MLKQVRKFCERNSILQQGSNVLVACSGGPDSMAMLSMLWELRQEMGFNLSAAHFEHGIRGQDSLDDASFVQQYCNKFNIPVYMGSENVPLWAKEHGESLETAARKLRYQFLQDTAKVLGGADIATAHHRDDQAETVLMHILRGSGLTGLSGIRPRRGNVIRPVLFLSKEQLLDYCYLNNIKARLDRTNEIPDCTRNRIRLKLMPNLTSTYNQGITEGLCNLAEIAAMDGDYMHREAVDIYNKLVTYSDGLIKFQRDEFLQLHIAMRRRVLQRMIRKVSLSTANNYTPMCMTNSSINNLGYIHIKLLTDFIEKGKTGRKLSLPGDVQASIDYGMVSIYRKTAVAIAANIQAITALNIPGKTVLNNLDAVIKAELYEGVLPEEFNLNQSPNIAVLDYQKCSGTLKVRFRSEGDRIYLKSGSKKIKEFFIDKKIPREDRNKIPLICDDNGILWVAGIKLTRLNNISAETKNFLVLSYERGV